MSAVLEVQGLVVGYAGKTVLHDVDLRVEPGEIMVIMGGSGSGKSTFLRCLLGLKAVEHGRIRILGEDIAQLDLLGWHKLRRQMGVAFQFGALFGSMTVGDNIRLPLEEHTKLDRATMDVMVRLKLEIVELPGFENLMPAELSGGMVKRAALARAIVMDPRLLFLDEPSAGLDPVVAASLDELILRLREATGMSVVVVTHELDSAFKIADRIMVLDNGRVLVSDTKDKVRQSGNTRVQDLLNRRLSVEEVDAEKYLARLTGERK